MIGKNNDNSGIPLHFKHNNGIIKDPYEISNAFCNFFTNVDPNHCNTSIQINNSHLIFRIALNVTQIVCSCHFNLSKVNLSKVQVSTI